MLSKILQINQNFISTCIIILFALLMMATDSADTSQLKDTLPLIFIVMSVIGLMISIRSAVYFPNQYFTFLVMLLSFAFYQGTSSFGFYAAFLFLSIIQSQLIMEIRHGNAILNPFDIGFFAGFMVFFYAPFVVFLIPIWFYYLVLGKVEVNRFILNLLGVFSFVVLFIELIAVFDWWGLWLNTLNQIQFNVIELNETLLFLLPALVIFLLSFIDYFKNINRHNVDKKLMFFYITISWIVSFIFILLWGGECQEYWFLLVIPTAIYLTNYFTFSKNTIKKEVYLWILIGSVLLFKFNQYIQLPHFFDNITF